MIYLLHVKTIGQLLANALNCVGPDGRRFNITPLNLTVVSIIFPQIGGFTGVCPLFDEIVTVVQNISGNFLPDLLHGALAITVRYLANTALNNAVVNLFLLKDFNCPPWIPAQDFEIFGNRVVEERTDPTFVALKTLFQFISPQSPSNFSIDYIIDKFTNPPGSVNLADSVLSVNNRYCKCCGSELNAT
jgi:hypothetical protein